MQAWTEFLEACFVLARWTSSKWRWMLRAGKNARCGSRRLGCQAEHSGERQAQPASALAALKDSRPTDRNLWHRSAKVGHFHLALQAETFPAWYSSQAVQTEFAVHAVAMCRSRLALAGYFLLRRR